MHPTHKKAREFAEAELEKLGYSVTTEKYPWTVISPEGKPFDVRVAGLRVKNSWPVREEKSTGNQLFHILVVTGKCDGDKPCFFIMTQEEVRKENDGYRSKLKKDGTKRSENCPGFTFTQAWQYKGEWGKLPK